MPEVIDKFCKFCGEVKTLEEFAPNKGGQYGRHSKCKTCTRKMHHDKREERLRSRREKRLQNPEAHREYARAYYKKHPHLFRNSVREARAEKRDWRAKNPERSREASAAAARRWRKANPFVTKMRSTARRNRSRLPDGTLKRIDVQALWERQEGKCRWCAEPLVLEKAHLDHIIPLIRGGDNRLSNLCWACEQCNLKKHDKLPWEFAEMLF